MTNNSFNYLAKRNIQTGREVNNITFSPSSNTYRKAVLSCTIGAMNQPPQFYSYPLIGYYFLEPLKKNFKHKKHIKHKK